MAGSWGAQQWVRLTPETTYGTYNTGGTPLWLRLTEDTPFDMRMVPQRQVIRSADSGNRKRQLVAPRKVCAGSLKTLFYPTQAAAILGLACTLTSNDLGSVTVDYFDTIQGFRFPGCKIASLNPGTDSQSDFSTMTLGLVGQSRTTVTLAQPADSVFPMEDPYVHYESKGLVTIGGTPITKYKQLGVSIANILTGTWDEDQYITSLFYSGRDIDCTITPQYLSAALRTAFEAQSAMTMQVAWSRPSGLTTTLNFETQSYISTITDSSDLGGATYQAINFQVFYDPTTGTASDLSFTVA